MKSKQKNLVLKSFQVFLLMTVLLAALFLGDSSSVLAQESTPGLFADAAAPLNAQGNPAFVTRTRYVHVNLGLLLDSNGKALSASASPEVVLNFFPDASFTGKVDRVQTSSQMGTSWAGRLTGNPNGYFYLVQTDGVFIAHAASALGVYEVSSVGGDLYKIIQIDQSRLGEDAPGEMEPSGNVISTADLGPNADSGATIDVMVVYTTAARVAEGSTAGMKARIALAVTEANTSYANAGITPRLRLVHTEEVSYTESGDISTDVHRLAATSDGYMDVVHSLRNTYAADMVSLVVENGGGYCGMADAIMATAATAFQVTARNGCMTGYYSFAHEFGHLQGARHDLYVDTGTTPYAFGHGYVHLSSTPANHWRTVMAYANKCNDSPYGYCNRLQYWSNPTKTYNTAKMGVVNSSENYRVLNATAVTVANFRASKISSNFSSTFNTSSSGWYAVKGAWGLTGSAYYFTNGLANFNASARHSGTYGDLTYQVRMKRTGTCTGCANNLVIRGNNAGLTSLYMWKPAYYFQYSNSGSFSVYEVTSAGAISALKPWTASSAIVKNNYNTLKVIAVGSSLKYYINGTLVWSGTDTSLRTGTVGLGLYRDPAAATLYVDSASLSTTPTADFNPNETVSPGVELSGGDINQAP